MSDLCQEVAAAIAKVRFAAAPHELNPPAKYLLDQETDAVMCVVEPIERMVETLPEWQCPGCGATTRARMADYPTERDGAALIAAKRHAVTAKGWTPEHDDQHVHGELLDAASCYANQGRTWFPEFTHRYGTDAASMSDQGWPWWIGEAPEGWRPSGDPIENLANAGQLIAAEIDRLVRAAGAS